jgi:hypothetical protein
VYAMSRTSDKNLWNSSVNAGSISGQVVIA